MDREQKTVIAMAEALDGAGPKTLVVGMPQGAIDYMTSDGGKTHHFTLEPLGIPLQVIIFSGKDYGDVVAQLASTNNFLGGDSSRDLGIPEPTEQ